MDNKIEIQHPLYERQIEVDAITVHVVQGGMLRKPTIMFLHGWPEDWSIFKRLMIALSEQVMLLRLICPASALQTFHQYQIISAHWLGMYAA